MAVRAEPVAFNHVLSRGREEDDRHELRPLVFAQPFEDLEPVHLRQMHVQEDELGIVEEVDELVVAGDGADALDYLVGEGPHVGRATTTMPCLRMASWT
jgi:hypothetical protein